jgi:hypothetical protein
VDAVSWIRPADALDAAIILYQKTGGAAEALPGVNEPQWLQDAIKVPALIPALPISQHPNMFNRWSKAVEALPRVSQSFLVGDHSDYAERFRSANRRNWPSECRGDVIARFVAAGWLGHIVIQ